jgi:acyl-coenzyme A thioesterase PaaI-like protein
MLRGTPLDGREIFADGEVLRRGRRTALAEVRVRDAEQRLLATATSSCLIVPRGASL